MSPPQGAEAQTGAQPALPLPPQEATAWCELDQGTGKGGPWGRRRGCWKNPKCQGTRRVRAGGGARTETGRAEAQLRPEGQASQETGPIWAVHPKHWASRS